MSGASTRRACANNEGVHRHDEVAPMRAYRGNGANLDELGRPVPRGAVQRGVPLLVQVRACTLSAIFSPLRSR